MIDVLYVTGGLGVGGTEQHLSLVLPELVRRGWRPEVALLADEGPFAGRLRDASIAVHRLAVPSPVSIPKLRGFLHLRGQARALAQRLRTAPPRLLHCFLPSSCIVGGWAASAARFKPVAMSRRSQASRPPLFFGDKWLERRALRRADLVFAHSRWVAAELQAEGVVPERIRLVPNGLVLPPLPSEVDRARARAGEGWAEEDIILLVVANLIPYKGHGDLLHGLATAANGGLSGWRLALVGDGAPSQVAALRQSATELGLGDRVSFLGRRLDVPRLLAGADIGILPSHHEGLSNALLEYMAAGLPVIATATGGNLDAVEDSKTGFLVPVGARDALGQAIARLMGDKALRQRMGAAGRAKAAADFSLDACVAGYESAYRSVLSAG